MGAVVRVEAVVEATVVATVGDVKIPTTVKITKESAKAGGEDNDTE